MVHEASQQIFMHMFLEIIIDPLKGFFKSGGPTTLQNFIRRTQDLYGTIPSFISTLRSKVPTRLKENISTPMDHRYFQKGPMDGTPRKDSTFRDKDELRRTNLCLPCQDPWVPGHKCAKGKAYCIEVLLEGGYKDVSEEEEHVEE